MQNDEPLDAALYPDDMEVIVCADSRIRIRLDGPGYKASWSEPLLRNDEDDCA